MLRLRPCRPGDAEKIVAWVLDERSFYQWSAGRFGDFPLTAQRMNEHYNAAGDDFFGMTAYDDSGLAGHFIMRFLDEARRDVRLGFIIVDPARRGTGCGKALLRLAFEYAFRLLGAQRVSLGVFENNAPAHWCYLRAGLRDTGGGWDCHLMGEDWHCCEMELTRVEYEKSIE